ncbi:MAG: DUF560 domain-containing protein [Phyllobacteriaceae bacterium]|nr:DUF560 domain-containing protein [Phyllobacteriaceae bacterium]
MSATHRFYPAINLHQTNLDAVVSVSIDKGRWGYAPALISGGAWSNWESARQYAGAKIDAWTRVGERVRLSGTLSAQREFYPTAASRDGWLFSVDTAADRFLSPSSFVRVIAGVSVKEAAAGRNSWVEGGGGLGFYREFSAGLSLYAEGRFAHRAYRETGFGLDSPQRDNRIEAKFVVTKSDMKLWGAAPQLSYGYTRNFSNNVFDDTERHDIDARLTKAF